MNKLTTGALLDRLGLQQKPSASARALTYGALLLGGVVVGAAAALFLAPRSVQALRQDARPKAEQLGEASMARVQRHGGNDGEASPKGERVENGT